MCMLLINIVSPFHIIRDNRCTSRLHSTMLSEEETSPLNERRRKRDVLKDWWTIRRDHDDEEVISSVDLVGKKIVDAPVLLNEDEVCLLPGDCITRVEQAPGNARRIFSAIDIFAPVDDVWGVMTDYENLQYVVPSLLKNDIIDRRSDGCRMTQVGAAELVPGISFRARCTLDVQEFPSGIPAELVEGGSEGLEDPTMDPVAATDIAKSKASQPLRRGIFPRPYAISHLQHRDLSMQSAEGFRGDFDLYQGVWRMQPLPGCASEDGGSAMRLSYAVELRPTLPVPVRLLEKRIALDLEKNLKAIRLHVESKQIGSVALVDSGNQVGMQREGELV